MDSSVTLNVDESQVTINVIYVKGTVQKLLPFLSTLVRHSCCLFRLVSNACTAEENDALRQYASLSERLSFLDLQTHLVLQHHDVLQRLLLLEQGPIFAFFDSDILARGPFLDKLLGALDRHVAVFTGLPLWHEAEEVQMPKHFRILGGRFLKSHDDMLFGLSYAALYRTEPLRQFIDSTKVDFRRYWWSDVPEYYRRLLLDIELNKEFYDTAKMLNILWQMQGASMMFLESDQLLHLGGISGPATHKGFADTLKGGLRKVIPKEMIRALKNRISWRGQIPFEEQENLSYLVKKRKLLQEMVDRLIYGEKDSISDFEVGFISDELKRRLDTDITEVRNLLNGSLPFCKAESNG